MGLYQGFSSYFDEYGTSKFTICISLCVSIVPPYILNIWGKKRYCLEHTLLSSFISIISTDVVPVFLGDISVNQLSYIHFINMTVSHQFKTCSSLNTQPCESHMSSPKIYILFMIPWYGLVLFSFVCQSLHIKCIE